MNPRRFPSGSVRLALLLSLLTAGCATRATDRIPSPPVDKTLPVAGHAFDFGGHEAFLLPPNKPARHPVPWVWYAPTLRGLPGPEERWMFERFLAAGIGVAGIDVGESYGSPGGVEAYEAFRRHLIRHHGWSPKPTLLARSRGGLMLLNWATGHPDSVRAIAGIYPVCDPSSYPGLDRAAPAYGLSPADLEHQLPRHNPLDRLGGLARKGVPVFLLHGDRDVTVPLERNSGELARRYEALGGPVTLEIPLGQGHSMWPGFFQSETLTGFVIRNSVDPVTRRSWPSPAPAR